MERVKEAIFNCLHKPCEPHFHDWWYDGHYLMICWRCWEVLELFCV